MALLLKQSTAHTFQLGPFIDDTDGKTAEPSLTIAYTSCYVSKAGGAMAAKSDTTNLTGTGDALGYYDCVLNTTDTGTLGNLRVHVHVAGALPVWQDFTVVPANVYDSLVAGTDTLQADVTQWIGTAAATPTTAGVPEVDVTFLNGSATNLLNLNASASTIVRGTVDTGSFSPTTTEFEADDITEATADHFNGRLIIFTSGALINQALRINDYALSGANGHFTVSAATEAPANNDTFVIV